uniref:uncharacterized protein LOC129522545 n=1 Tax=Nyctereutes procyonoides TaxID=34880 RepID=UPI0024441C93|nr:uncharacterized protein LOC129522545 [Nyctereutes procyonoides]
MPRGLSTAREDVGATAGVSLRTFLNLPPPPPNWRRCSKCPILWCASGRHRSPQSQMAVPRWSRLSVRLRPPKEFSDVMGEGRCWAAPLPPRAGRAIASRAWRLLSQLPLSRYQAKSPAGACASLEALIWAGSSVTGALEAPEGISRSERCLYLGKLHPWGDTPEGELIPSGKDPKWTSSHGKPCRPETSRKVRKDHQESPSRDWDSCHIYPQTSSPSPTPSPPVPSRLAGPWHTAGTQQQMERLTQDSDLHPTSAEGPPVAVIRFRRSLLSAPLAISFLTQTQGVPPQGLCTCCAADYTDSHLHP